MSRSRAQRQKREKARGTVGIHRSHKFRLCPAISKIKHDNLNQSDVRTRQWYGRCQGDNGGVRKRTKAVAYFLSKVRLFHGNSERTIIRTSPLVTLRDQRGGSFIETTVLLYV